MCVILICSILSTQALDKNNPWTSGLGINLVDITSTPNQLVDYVGIINDSNILPVLLSRLYVARYLDNGFTVDFTGSFNSIDKIPDITVEEKYYYALDLGIKI